jgi:hypothetical protein
MALVLADRVKETATGTSGDMALTGAVSGFVAFDADATFDSNTTYYTLVDADGTKWEVGLGTLSADSTTLTRTTILATQVSFTDTTRQTFSSGTHTVFCTYAADKSVHLDASGNLSHRTIPYTSITGDTTLTTSNEVVFVNATSGEVDVTLYAAASNGGRTLIIKKTDSSSNAVIILRAASETIDGAVSITLYHQNESITLMSDNSNWFIV